MQLWGRATVWWCSITFLSPFFPLSIPLKFMFTPTLTGVRTIEYSLLETTVAKGGRSRLIGMDGSLSYPRSKRSGTKRTKFGPSHSGRAKNGARAKRWKERGGGGDLLSFFFFFPSFLSPTPFLPPRCSRSIILAARM